MFIGTMDGKANVTGREPSVPHATTNNKSQAHHLHTRRWLTISADDPTESSFLELSKTRVTHQLGLQLRDLRLLDPHLATSYPSAILARDRALIVNLEYIKMIVGRDRCYITSLEDPNTTAFVEELQRRLSHPAGSHAAMGISPSVPALPQMSAAAGADNKAPFLGQHHSMPDTAASMGQVAPHMELPFELRVLECALDLVCRHLEQQVVDLEAAAHPALDGLTQKINTPNLERVRRIKNRMVRLTTRVETLKELLEKILDDDSDMKDLNLSAKEVERQESMRRQSLRLSMAGTPFDVPIGSSGMPGAELQSQMSMLGSTPLSPNAPSVASDDLEDDDVAVVEQLLESYFMQVDNSWNKLQTLTEYIDDTEDFINIELDSHRNQLIRLDLMLTSLTASMALITAITSLFAMNVVLSPSFEDKAPFSWFVTIACTCGVSAILCMAGIFAYCKWKRLI